MIRRLVALAATLALLAGPTFGQSIPFPGPGLVTARPAITNPVSLGTFTRGQVGATNQFTFTTTAAIPSGATAFVAVAFNGAGTPQTVSTVSDGTNSYVKAVGQTNGTDDVELWYKLNASAVGSGATITITFTGTYGSSGYGTASAAYATNVTGPVDKTAGQATTGTTPTISTGTLTVPRQIVIGVSYNDDSNPSFTEDSGNGWTNTNLTGSAAGSRHALSYVIVNATTSKSWAPVWGASGTLTTVLASFEN